jgi:hypothetical protein
VKAALHTLLGLLLLAAPGVVRAQFEYTTNADNTLTITGYTGSGGAVTIPTNIDGLTVTSIGDDAFQNCFSLTNIKIPARVTSVGDYAFLSCYRLTNATIGNDVTSIGLYAFDDCSSLTSITIPNSVTKIGESAFEYCSGLTNVRISDSVTYIGVAAFSHCVGLTNITIPASVTSIGNAAFFECFNLTSVMFQGNAPAAPEGNAFAADFGATVYYLPGTTGWNEFATNAGVPALLWNPLIQTGDGSFGISNNQFGFNITGTTSIPIVVEACTNLANPIWTPLQSLNLTNGSFYFNEPFQTSSSGRFYRISSP